MSIKFRAGTLLLAILLVCALLVQTASSKELLTASEKPSDLEQGLIDALNSNKINMSADEIVADYFEENEILTNSVTKVDTTSEKTKLRTYQLKDESYITFTNKDFFYITAIKEEINNSAVNQKNVVATSTSTSTTPPIRI